MKDILSKLKNIMDQVRDHAPARNRYFQTQLFERSQKNNFKIQIIHNKY